MGLDSTPSSDKFNWLEWLVVWLNPLGLAESFNVANLCDSNIVFR